MTLTGEIVSRGTGWILILGEDKRTYFALAHSLLAPRGHVCIYAVGAKVIFKNDPHYSNKSKPRAMDVEVLDAPPVWQDREISVVIEWHKTRTGAYGFCERSCGDRLFISASEIENSGTPVGQINLGTWIEHDVDFNESKKKWRATKVRVVPVKELENINA